MKVRPKVKAKEIAKQLGVSPATVSLAINNKPGVNANTKRRILEHIDKQEHADASLYGETILLLRYVNKNNPDWPENSILFHKEYTEFFRMVQQERMELRLQHVYSLTELDRALKEVEGKAQGVVFRADELPDDEKGVLDQCKLPMVVCASDLRGGNWDAVNFHNEKVVQDGLEILVSCGHRDIVYLQNTFPIYNFCVRRKGYQRFVAENPNLKLKAQLVATGEYIEPAADAIADYLNKRGSLPDAVFCENYMVSIALSLAVQRMGIVIPDDMSVVGVDAIQSTAFMPYNMDHFQVPHAEHMKIAGELLYARIRNTQEQQCPKEVRLAMKYVPGDTIRKR